MKLRIAYALPATAVALAAVLFEVVAAGQAAHSAPEFRRGTAEVRKATLNDLAAHRAKVAPDDLGEILSLSLNDTSEDVRKRAMYAIAGRATAIRLAQMRLPGERPAPMLKELTSTWHVERPVLVGLRDKLVAALSDASPDVRNGAIIALVSLEYEPGMPPNFAVRPETLDVLAERFDKESALPVRVQIVKTMALTPTGSASREALLLRALNDPAPGVIQFAAMGVGEARLTAALPRLAELLAHDHRAVRLNAAQAIVLQGPPALAYRAHLQEALTKEPDDIVKKSLEGALTKLDEQTSPRRQ